eukprot:GHVH01006349.1.p1 GENE.GHVH01006349.1~~GHVH01006349.1.p1  ORF type:complete len:178 (-),score=20.20 GHVH01006349.1:13-546(-)
MLQNGAKIILTDGNDKVVDMLSGGLRDLYSTFCRESGIDMTVRKLEWKNGFTEEDHEALGVGKCEADVIIGADITHWPSTSDLLPATVSALLSPSGVAVIAGVKRAQVTYDIMIRGFQSHGLYTTAVTRESSTILTEIIEKMTTPSNDDLFLWLVSKDLNHSDAWIRRFKDRVLVNN